MDRIFLHVWKWNTFNKSPVTGRRFLFSTLAGGLVWSLHVLEVIQLPPTVYAVNRLIADYKLPMGVKLSMNGCLSLCGSPVIHWRPVQGLSQLAQHLFILRRPKKIHLSPQILVNFHRCTINSTLNNCIIVWYCNCPIFGCRALSGGSPLPGTPSIVRGHLSPRLPCFSLGGVTEDSPY